MEEYCNVAEIDHIEALGALHAVQFLQDLEPRDIHIEGDSLTIVNAINSTNQDLSNVGKLIEDIRMRPSDFIARKCSLVRRHGNRGAAHMLARRACRVMRSKFGWRMVQSEARSA
ncbi:hypothetical protein Acr_20g0011810 [Actinidia rufa]|uniref:RNase H type-1 domain-containing protein n=1 Tax=Actinidia rufa TaxID=165716 RepID=A0A7J0GEZ1_9ERIC|nr:hypothetical protein Acr_20g0011810 [Actinidia rufa]